MAMWTEDLDYTSLGQGSTGACDGYTLQASILEEGYGFAERYYFNSFLFTTRVVAVLGYIVGCSDTALSC
jgi:hypothetical protein